MQVVLRAVIVSNVVNSVVGVCARYTFVNMCIHVYTCVYMYVMYEFF